MSHPWEYFERLAEIVRGTVYMLHLTGGEPTAHPQFAEFVPRFKGLFGAQSMTMWTNGYRVRENAHVLRHFDEIWATKYGEDNAAEIDWLKANYKTLYCDAPHVERSHRGTGRPCERGLTHPGAAFANGRFYPCCVGPGIPGAASIEPTRNWRQDVLSVPMPCSDCWFSPTEKELMNVLPA